MRMEWHTRLHIRRFRAFRPARSLARSLSPFFVGKPSCSRIFYGPYNRDIIWLALTEFLCSLSFSLPPSPCLLCLTRSFTHVWHTLLKHEYIHTLHARLSKIRDSQDCCRRSMWTASRYNSMGYLSGIIFASCVLPSSLLLFFVSSLYCMSLSLSLSLSLSACLPVNLSLGTLSN